MAKSKKKSNLLYKFFTSPKGLLLSFLVLLFLANFGYQLYKKPFEVISTIYSGVASSPRETLKRYHDAFLKYSTRYVAPETLASIAQLESGGRHWASPQWKWKFTLNWRQIFAPASSAFGLMQLTNGHVEEVDSYCIDRGKLVKNCRFSWFYSRLLPSHSIELAAIYLHKTIANLKRTFDRRFNEIQLRRVAAVIHLCGKNRATEFVKKGLRFQKSERCGTHNVSRYIEKVDQLAGQLKNHFTSSMPDKSN